jgi:hypothetical protein
MMDRMKFRVVAFSLSLALTGSQCWADEHTESEATIRLMGNAEAALPDAVTKEIKLPAHLLEADADDQVATVEKAEKGLAKANERNEHRENGQSQADEARERGAEMSDKAKESRENRSRSEDHPTPPEPPKGPPNN